MKAVKLVIGIISIVFTFVVLFQSCAASVGDALANTGGTSGGAGMFVAILLLIAGVVAIATPKSKAGGIVCLVFYALAGIIGLTAHGIYKDLIVWGILCLIFAVIFLIATITYKKKGVPESTSAEKTKG